MMPSLGFYWLECRLLVSQESPALITPSVKARVRDSGFANLLSITFDQDRQYESKHSARIPSR
jgi:hypothetical protein